MKWLTLLSLSTVFLLLAACQRHGVAGRSAAASAVTPTSTTETSADDQRIEYPATERGDQEDQYHGTTVADPYRWLEDLDSEPTGRWVAAQNEVTSAFLSAIPQQKPIRDRLTQLWDFERFGLPTKKGGRYFFTRNDGLQNQSMLYVADGLEAEPRVLLDPNKLSADGTVALTSWHPSEDGKVLAYGLAASGSDWQQWRTLDIDTGQPRSDHLKWIKFSDVAWTADNRGFFYSRYDEPLPDQALTGVNYYQKLYYHQLGDEQARDTLVYERPDEKEWGFAGDVSEDGRYLIIHVWRGTERKNQLFYRDLQDPQGGVVELITGFDAQYEFVGNDGTTFWVLTDSDAPRRRLLAIDIAAPRREQWRELVAETPHVLEQVSVVGERFVLSYLQDARSAVRIASLDGQLGREVELPAIGTVAGLDGTRTDSETFYSLTNFSNPGTIYRYDVATGEQQPYRSPRLAFRPEDYETRQVFYHSKDGTRIPMFITHRRGLKLDGDQPTLLYGYGGFNIALTPRFSVSNLVWMEMGGIYAVPNLRGGGEYGRQWHEDGMLDKKQNVFDDFIAAGQWLIDNGYTNPRKLAIQGRSNGGLLVGACMAQRPDMFAAALPAVGVMDMLRYHQFTIGWAWVSEYGSSADAEQFPVLHAYSPLHNLRPGTNYPATLITTADHDDRVVPGHSFKFAAALQHAQTGDAPTLIRIETSAGHGAGKPTTKQIEEAADILAFTCRALKMDDQPNPPPAQ